MPRFKLVATNNSRPPVEFDGPDAGAALNIANQMDLEEAELWHEGTYVCTLRQVAGPDGGYWVIVQKTERPQSGLQGASVSHDQPGSELPGG